MDADAGEAFDSMLNRDARFWGEIDARKVFAAAAAVVIVGVNEQQGDDKPDGVLATVDMRRMKFGSSDWCTAVVRNSEFLMAPFAKLLEPRGTGSSLLRMDTSASSLNHFPLHTVFSQGDRADD